MEGEDWLRLASYVRRRRVDLGYRERKAFAEDITLDYRTLGTLETGRRVGDNSLAIVEQALGWKPGSAHAILRGGEPTLVAPAPDAEADDLPELVDPLEIRLWDALTEAGFPVAERWKVIADARGHEVRRLRGNRAS